MKKVHLFIDKSLQIFVGVGSVLLVVLTFGQVVGRYLFGRSFGWAEELSVLIFCWMVWTTACLLLKDNRHLSVNLLISKLSAPYRREVNLLIGVVVLVFLGVVVYAGFGTMEAMADIKFITLPLPLNIKFVSIPVGAALMAYYVARGMFWNSKGNHNGNR